MEGPVNPENITEDEMMREFMRTVNVDIRPNELTVGALMEFAHVKRKRAQYFLAKLEEKNILKSRDVIVNGRLMNAYSPLNGTWADVIKLIAKE